MSEKYKREIDSLIGEYKSLPSAENTEEANDYDEAAELAAYEKRRAERIEKHRRQREEQLKKRKRILMCAGSGVLALLLITVGISTHLKKKSTVSNALVSSSVEEIKPNTPIANGAMLVNSPALKDQIVADPAESDAITNSTEETPKYVWAQKDTPIAPEDDPAQLEGKEKIIYLTFDDGPSDYTAELLDILKQYDVKVTFFVVGLDTKNLDLITREAEDGHSIAIHSFTHDYVNIYASTQHSGMIMRNAANR